MADITEIVPGQLWTGGAVASEQDVADVVAAGITADIDCRLDFDDESLIKDYENLPNAADLLEKHPKIAYLWNGVADDGQPKPVEWFAKSWDFAKPLLDNGAVLLVHCAAGINRGPSMTYFLLRAYSKMSGDDAFALLRQKRPVVEAKYRPDADEAIIALGLDK